MAILDPRVETFEHGPDSGSFFYGEFDPQVPVSDADFARFSCTFWVYNRDLIAGEGLDSAALMQFSYDEQGEVVMADKESRTTKPQTLLFRANDIGHYQWKLVEPDESGRTETAAIAHNGEVQVLSVGFDTQGRRGKIQTLSAEAKQGSLRKIQEIIASGAYGEQVKGMRKRREEAEAQIGEFVIKGSVQYAPTKYRKLLEEKKKVLDHLYFADLGATL